MKTPVSRLVALAFAALVSSLPAAQAGLIYSGSATFTLLEGKANSIAEFDALFSAGTSRANTLSLPAPGNAPFTETAANVQYTDAIRGQGVVPPTGDGRVRQITNLDFNPVDILGSWAASTDSGLFVTRGPSSEQIGFTLMQRWAGPFTGALIYGDFALRYVPARAGVSALDGTLSGLVLTSNIDFLNAAYADLANASISYSGDTLNISGDLLIAQGLTALDPGAVLGTKFGTFSMQGFSSVPEPSTALFGLSLLATGGFRRRPRPGIVAGV